MQRFKKHIIKIYGGDDLDQLPISANGYRRFEYGAPGTQSPALVQRIEAIEAIKSCREVSRRTAWWSHHFIIRPRLEASRQAGCRLP